MAKIKDIITLSNGKKVANFSSPHSFQFEDGSVLPAVSNEESERLKVDFIEEDLGGGDIGLKFKLSQEVIEEISNWSNAYFNKLVDVVFCPLPMITALKERGYNLKNSPFRAVRIEDRINKLVSINKQCI